MNSPKVLYVGVYRDATGYGRAAIDNILSLDAAGVDVVCRPLKLNASQAELPERVLQLEAKSARGADVAIQHTLPHLMDYSGHFASCIGMFASETSNFKDSVWAERLNAMDAVWVINRQSAFAARESGVTVPISIVPHATNVSKFNYPWPVLSGIQQARRSGAFLFYFVGEMVRRKNLAALLKAFYTEFREGEPVELVLKVSSPGMNHQQVQQEVGRFLKEIQQGLKIPSAGKQPIVISQRLNDAQMCSLHASCDCLVAPSYGEAWHLPAADAMGFGKTPIVTACTGFLDYIDENVGWLVDCTEEPVFGEWNGFADMYTANENWWSVDVGHLRRCIREVYERPRPSPGQSD
jgi:glycosyltransferase involved in cell wall biosynthesis